VSGETVADAVFTQLFPKSSQVSGSDAAASEDMMSKFVKNICQLDACAEILAPNSFPPGVRLRSELATQIRMALQEKIPLEAHSPSLGLDDLSPHLQKSVLIKRFICHWT
jgi:hypothetical protein